MCYGIGIRVSTVRIKKVQMAKTVSEEEIQLRKRARRRLVGAITLVIAAVVVLPMVLDSKPEQRSHEIEIRIPSEDSVEELGPESASPPKATAIPEKPATEIEQEKPTTSGPDVTAGQFGNSPGPSAASERTDVSPIAAPEVFVVQLGAFSAPAKAKQQLQSVASKGITAYTETLKSGKDEITRVRVGPFDTREEAERTREKLKKLGFEGVVTEK
jgi:DedD protein